MAVFAAAALSFFATPALGREAVQASPPQALAVTIYRDPSGNSGSVMNREFPQGLAMITETTPW